MCASSHSSYREGPLRAPLGSRGRREASGRMPARLRHHPTRSPAPTFGSIRRRTSRPLRHTPDGGWPTGCGIRIRGICPPRRSRSWRCGSSRPGGRLRKRWRRRIGVPAADHARQAGKPRDHESRSSPHPQALGQASLRGPNRGRLEARPGWSPSLPAAIAFVPDTSRGRAVDPGRGWDAGSRCRSRAVRRRTQAAPLAVGTAHNCTDILPGRIASALESSGEVRLGMRRSYGAAAHQLRNWRAPDDLRGSRVP